MHGEQDFLLAGRKLGFGLVTMSLFATWFGAETLMGSAAAIAQKGLAGGRADPFGYALCLFLMAILLAYQMRAKGYVTLGDFFRDRFGPANETLAVIIMIPTSIIWASAQLFAFSQILVVVADVNADLALLAAAAIVITYTVLGGLLGDAMNDLLQGAIILLGVVILLVLTIDAAGGLAAAFDKIEAKQLSFVDPDEGAWARWDVWAIPLIGSLVSQEAIQRFLGAKDADTARRACFAASGIYVVVGLLPVFFALVGAHMNLEFEHRDAFLPSLAMQLMPTWLFVIFIGALFAAILSTVDSTLLAAAGLTTRNIVERIQPGLSDRARLLLNRIMVVIAGVAAYVVARDGESIYDLVQTSSSFGTAGIAVTALFGLWTGLGGPAAALTSLAVGVASMFAGKVVMDVEAPFLLSVVTSLVAFLAVAIFEKRTDRA
ncbi:MAG TPA: sodium:solute symporter family protein [Rhodospirillales bacterium]